MLRYEKIKKPKAPKAKPPSKSKPQPLPKPASASKRYKVIVADPAWNFETWSHRGEDRSAVQHYPCMSLAEICALPVAEVVADDAALFLWVVQPMLPQALDVIKAWGFTFKTVAFVWIKMAPSWVDDIQGSFVEPKLTPRMGLGYHTRSGAEQCWLAVRGKGYERAAQDVEQVLHAPQRQHSRKPDEFMRRIERLCGDVPRLELFARTKRDGWDAWGDELGKFKEAAE